MVGLQLPANRIVERFALSTGGRDDGEHGVARERLAGRGKSAEGTAKMTASRGTVRASAGRRSA